MILVVFLFLRSGRATLIPAVAVPVSLIGTFAAMYLCGFSLNNLSLMALTIATGFVVDDAIVVLENISRHLEAGMKPLQAAYNLELDRPQIRQMDPGLVYNAVRDGFVDAGLIYTTDGRVKGFDLKVLEDDKGFFPSYAVTPVVRKDTLEANPGLEEALNTLSAQLNNDVITELNKKVDIDHQSPQQVARDFLRSKQLL